MGLVIPKYFKIVASLLANAQNLFKERNKMARLTIVLNEICGTASAKESARGYSAAQAAVMGELAGADGVAYRVDTSGLTPPEEKIIKTIREVVEIPVALIIPANDKVIEKAIDLKPDMVVIYNYPAGIQEQITRLQVSDIVTALLMPADLDLVKEAAKIKADYVVLDVTSYCAEKSLSNKMNILEKIAKASALTKRLSMETIISGPLKMVDLPKFAAMEGVEEFFIGHELVSKAVMFGLEKAIGRCKKAITE
jgi:pyridoxine 5-phosphate synthase